MYRVTTQVAPKSAAHYTHNAGSASLFSQGGSRRASLAFAQRVCSYPRLSVPHTARYVIPIKAFSYSIIYLLY